MFTYTSIFCVDIPATCASDLKACNCINCCAELMPAYCQKLMTCNCLDFGNIKQKTYNYTAKEAYQKKKKYTFIKYIC